MKWKEKYEAKIKRIIKQVTGFSVTEDGELEPAVLIKGTGYIWCYGPMKNKFLRVSRGIQAYIVDEKEDERGRILIYTANAQLLLIDASEVIPTGFD